MPKLAQSSLSNEFVAVNRNSRNLFPSGLVKYTPNSHDDYLRVIASDKSGAIKSFFSNPENAKNPLLLPALEQTFTHLAGDDYCGKIMAKKMHSHHFEFFSTYERATEENLEDFCRQKLGNMLPDYSKLMGKKAAAGAREAFSSIKPLLEGRTVLDIGAGNGKIGSLISTRLEKDVTLIDVQDYKLPEVVLPMNIFDGKTLSYKDGQFDSSMLLMVLHHADEPLKLLEEAIRVTSGKIYVMESIYFNKEHRQLATMLEWQFNRVFDNDEHWPCNFQTPSGWADTFSKYNLKMEKSVNLGIASSFAPDYQWLFVLSKSA
ncbi:Methyltransferase domain protein [uncultured archaeon]|nr:Methyltransferase domain protein [uncultured archaeon]